MGDNEDSFKRSIAFTFYSEWAEMVKEIQLDYGKEVVADFLIGIINYALYEEEPDLKPPIKYFWAETRAKIDASQKHRAKGFGNEDKEMTEKILKYKKENPTCSQRDISMNVGCSLSKVNKVLKKLEVISSVSCDGTKEKSVDGVNEAHLFTKWEDEKEVDRNAVVGDIEMLCKNKCKYEEIIDLMKSKYSILFTKKNIYDFLHNDIDNKEIKW